MSDPIALLSLVALFGAAYALLAYLTSPRGRAPGQPGGRVRGETKS